MEKIEISFEYTPEEYVFGVRKHMLAAKIVRRYDIALAVIFLVFSLFYMFRTDFNTLSVMLFAALIIVVALGSWLYFIAPARRFKRTDRLRETCTLTFTPDCILWKTPSLDSRIQWEVFTQFWSSERFYFLVQIDRLYTLVPKRAFKSEDDTLAFERMAAEKIRVHRTV